MPVTPLTRKTAGAPPPSYLERLRDWLGFVLVLWGVEIVDRFLFGQSLQNHGIHPRSLSHLEGLFFAPFLHTGWNHLTGNSLSLLLLGALILATGWRDLLAVCLTAAAVGGATVWFIGQTGTNHIGASTLVFGCLAFLLASGFYRPAPGTILVSVAILVFYGSAFAGVLPTDSVRAAGISWEGHLGGALGGLLVARHRRRKFASHSRPSAR